MNLFFGVDACRGDNGMAWAIAAVREDGQFHSFWIVDSFEKVLEAVKSKPVPLTLVDIPIGLKSSGPDERKCDPEARKIVGKRGPSVFRVPVRQAVYALCQKEGSEINKRCTRKGIGEEGSEINKRYKGKGISAQTWGIVKKIKEVDRLLSQEPALQSRVRETHPEVCFCGLNSGSHLCHGKKEKNRAGLKERPGLDERLEILSKFSKDAETWYTCALKRYRRRQLARDDILDAMAAAITALKCCQDKPYTFPKTSTEKDDKGLRMEIVYWLSPAH